MEQLDPLEKLLSSLSPISPEELERQRQGALRLIVSASVLSGQ